MGDLFGIVIVRPFGIALMFIYQLVQSYGLAVILFAVMTTLLLLPLGYHSKKGMRKMTAVQGKMQELQKKYANNKAKLNEEVMKLYEKENISPMGGCLPTFIQLPIMMGLYYAVQKPLTFMMGISDESITKLGELVGINVAEVAASSVTYQLDIAQALNQFLDGAGQFTQQVTSISSDIAQYLIPVNFSFLGLDLSMKPEFTNPSILWIIPILSGLTAFLSSWLSQKMQGTTIQGTMKTMLYTMPLMSVYFGFIFPASIGIYWVARNVLMILQEFTLTKVLNWRHPIESDIQKAEREKEEKRRAHEEKMKRLAEQGAQPNPNTSKKKK